MFIHSFIFKPTVCSIYYVEGTGLVTKKDVATAFTDSKLHAETDVKQMFTLFSVDCNVVVVLCRYTRKASAVRTSQGAHGNTNTC